MNEKIYMEVKCTLCGVSSDYIFVMAGISAGEKIFICLDCLSEGVKDKKVSK